MIARVLAFVFAALFSAQGIAFAQEGQAWIFRGARMDEIPAPGVRPCRALWEGETVNTRLLRSRDDKLVLIASWHTWDHTGYPIPGTLRVDGGETVSVTGYSIGPLVMVKVEDDQLLQALREARLLQWSWPWGEFSTEISGLGVAFDALGPCPG
ncbi:MAG: hypothetical protein R3C27_12050 [Hyphomonadaceae bacterium]